MALCLIHKCDPIWGFYFINIRPYDLVERLSFAKLYSSVYNGNVWTVHKFVIDRCMCRDSHNLTALSLTCPLYTLDSHWPVINLLTGGNVLLFVCVHLNNDFLTHLVMCHYVMERILMVDLQSEMIAMESWQLFFWHVCPLEQMGFRLSLSQITTIYSSLWASDNSDTCTNVEFQVCFRWTLAWTKETLRPNAFALILV